MRPIRLLGKPMVVEYVVAPNDANGNPQRGWLVAISGATHFIDEGLAGFAALKRHFPQASSGDRLNIRTITTSEYRFMKRLGEPPSKKERAQ